MPDAPAHDNGAYDKSPRGVIAATYIDLIDSYPASDPCPDPDEHLLADTLIGALKAAGYVIVTSREAWANSNAR